MSRFENIFDRKKTELSRQHNFQARLFGIFNEEIVRIWAKSNSDGYCDLGRPTVYLSNGKHPTFDFTLQKDEKNYLTEMKCWLPFENYKYFELNDAEQLGKVAKDGAFKVFMDIAQQLTDFTVKVSGAKEATPIHGVILIWGKVKSDKKEEIKNATKIHEILALEDIIEDLLEAQNKEYTNLIARYREWSNSFFDMLVSKETR
jgi:hypothetical protein